MRCGDLKESYLEDEKIFQSVFVKFWLVLLFAFLILFPHFWFVDSYWLYIANLTGFAVIGAVGLNLLTGFTGQISLGHAAFIGVGGYATAILITRLGVPFLVCLTCRGFDISRGGVDHRYPFSSRERALFGHRDTGRPVHT